MKRGVVACAAIAAAAALTSTGCSVPREAGFPEVRDTVKERTGHRIHWNEAGVAEQHVADRVRELTKKPLTAETAVSVALLNNRRLQATYEGLGIAQADLVQAGMLENPSVGAGVRLGTGALLGSAIDGDFHFDFLNAFTLAARKRVASARFEAVKLQVASDVIELVTAVRASFLRLQAAQQLQGVALAIAQASQGSIDTARALHAAGNINDLQLAQEQAQYEENRLAWIESQGEVTQARERLNRLLGLWRAPYAWKVVAPLRGIPAKEVPLARLESTAIAARLDLAAAKRRTDQMAASLQLQTDWGWLQHAHAGADLESDLDGEPQLGPHVSFSLPIFDQGQARRFRARAALKRSYHRVSAMAVDIRSEVRLARADLVRLRRIAVHRRDVLVPLRERIVALTMRHYNFMLVGAFDLLRKKQMEAQSYRAYILAVRDYWLAHNELTRLVGGRIPATRKTTEKP